MLSRPILALAAASFGIGTTEFVIMGLLPDVAGSLHVSIPQALVSGYAMGVVVGAPIVAIATAGLPRKTALLALWPCSSSAISAARWRRPTGY